MTLLMKSELNALAANLCFFDGYRTPEDHDFHKNAKKSPRDKKYWNMALVAWATLKHDDEALEFQVK